MASPKVSRNKVSRKNASRAQASRAKPLRAKFFLFSQKGLPKEMAMERAS